jgi:DNA polymerase III epsilon subunit family exonuclease
MKNLIPILLAMLALPALAALRDMTFVAFDVETTGFSPDTERVIEIGAAKYRNGAIVDSTHWLVNPGLPIRNSHAHGITDADVQGHPRFSDTYKAFTNFVGDGILIAHNASFDVRFLSAEIKRNQLAPIPNPAINSLTLFRRWYPGLPSHKLEDLATQLDVPVAVAHRAEDDSRTLLLILDRTLASRPTTTFAEMKAAANGTYHFDGSRTP